LRIKAGGTGLGLYLTRKIICELLKGSVSLESRVGEGSTFGLKVPIDLRAALDASVDPVPEGTP
jgi:signal transduction histidine kinase